MTMKLSPEHQRLKDLLSDTITLLVKNGLQFKTKFTVEALIGITIDEEDVVLVNINESVQNAVEKAADTSVKEQSSSRKRHKRKRPRSTLSLHDNQASDSESDGHETEKFARSSKDDFDDTSVSVKGDPDAIVIKDEPDIEEYKVFSTPQGEDSISENFNPRFPGMVLPMPGTEQLTINSGADLGLWQQQQQHLQSQQSADGLPQNPSTSSQAHRKSLRMATNNLYNYGCDALCHSIDVPYSLLKQHRSFIIARKMHPKYRCCDTSDKGNGGGKATTECKPSPSVRKSVRRSYLSDATRSSQDSHSSRNDKYLRRKIRLRMSKKNIPKYHWTLASTKKMAEFIKGHKELFDKKNYAWLDKNTKAQRWTEAGQQLEPPASGEQCKKLYENMRTRVGRITKNSKKSGSSAKEPSDRDKQIMETWGFLQEHIVRGKSCENFDSQVVLTVKPDNDIQPDPVIPYVTGIGTPTMSTSAQSTASEAACTVAMLPFRLK